MEKQGWYANIALAVNLLFLFGILASRLLYLHYLVLLVCFNNGYGVDANIIIYERAKEELRAGKSLDEL
jgi:SecD/SecF fusion protein